MSRVSKIVEVSFTTTVTDREHSVSKTAQVSFPLNTIIGDGSVLAILERLRNIIRVVSDGTNASNPIDNA